jgi:hypothetical protein
MELGKIKPEVKASCEEKVKQPNDFFPQRHEY